MHKNCPLTMSSNDDSFSPSGREPLCAGPQSIGSPAGSGKQNPAGQARGGDLIGSFPADRCQSPFSAAPRISPSDAPESDEPNCSTASRSSAISRALIDRPRRRERLSILVTRTSTLSPTWKRSGRCSARSRRQCRCRHPSGKQQRGRATKRRARRAAAVWTWQSPAGGKGRAL